MSDQHYYTIATHEGYKGVFETREAAEHERRVMFGNRALAHSIVRVHGKPRVGAGLEAPRLASTLRAGETIAYRGTQVEILRDAEPCKDILGREMFHFWAKRLDTGAEGWLMFGEGGVV